MPDEHALDNPTVVLVVLLLSRRFFRRRLLASVWRRGNGGKLSSCTRSDGRVK